MIKIITSDTEDKIKQLEFSGDVEEVAKEIIASIMTVRDIINEENEDLARIFEISVEEYLEIGLYKNKEDADHKAINEMACSAERLKQLIRFKRQLESLAKNEKPEKDKVEDIRAADFDSDEQFKEWFRGLDK